MQEATSLQCTMSERTTHSLISTKVKLTAKKDQFRRWLLDGEATGCGRSDLIACMHVGPGGAHERGLGRGGPQNPFM